MPNSDLIDKCKSILEFWKLEEYFTPVDYPNLLLKIKEGKREVPFDAYYNEYSTRALPLNAYNAHNMYLLSKNKNSNNLYDRANVYFGCYKLNVFLERMVERCGLDIENYEDISNLTNRFYIFSIQVDLNGKPTDEGVQISPFFYAVARIIIAGNTGINIQQKDIRTLNEDINEILAQNDVVIHEFSHTDIIKQILFEKLGIKSESDIGLEAASKESYACKGLKVNEDTVGLNSFFIDDLETVYRHFKDNEGLLHYIASFLNPEKERKMLDSDTDLICRWLDADRFPMAKYPSRFSPTLMQQVAINIAISEKERKEKIFSVNGPPGTGKTTLLKEIIASNIEKSAEAMIKYGIDNNEFFVSRKIESESNAGYTDKYYEIPEEIAKYGVLVVSNNNGAVENITLDLPKADGLSKDKTWTGLFDRKDFSEIYFSKVADKLLGDKGMAWGLISARMGRKKYISEVLDSCIFSRKNDEPGKVTLDSAKNDSISWKQAVDMFEKARNKVLKYRAEIKIDQKQVNDFYKHYRQLEQNKSKLNILLDEKEILTEKRKKASDELKNNENNTLAIEGEIKYIISHTTFFKKLLIYLGIGNAGKSVAEKRKNIETLVAEHTELQDKCSILDRYIEESCSKIEKQHNTITKCENKVNSLYEKLYGGKNSLKNKYKNNFADKEFYGKIKENEQSQNACPWTYEEYDRAREELFFASLQVRKAFILESVYIRRNLFVYHSFNSGKYTSAEKKEMFPHLLNALSIVVPVLSSTFASVGNFLKYAGNKSLGMLVIDESGQAVPQAALGALYRTKNAVVVGDPLQVEPVVTIPQILVDLLADATGVANDYRSIENSVQTFADSMNEFNGMIGQRKVGCPLVVHRRCIEPMFSISNRISYDGRMFNKTSKKEEYLTVEQPFMLKKSGWINVTGSEAGSKNHFVEKQAEKVCKLIERATSVYDDLFQSDDKIFVISPFRTVAFSMCEFVIQYFTDRGYGRDLLQKWVMKNIGTVHTFQGKDANEVLVLLGCSSKSEGAMNWVVKKANILNVACTRAKYRIAFIGNIEDWKNRNFFVDFIPDLINIIES